ncbi:TPA: hypothetical protein DCE37_25230 [Candidatus Latescibacteria bacterium]|nr:hypothetical protein [Candidatus Latescibacterota bacterium]
MITSSLSEIRSRNVPLTFTGFIHLAVLAGCLMGTLIDTRTILGINPRIKPAKFAISITIFVWTMAWLLAYLPDYPRAVRDDGRRHPRQLAAHAGLRYPPVSQVPRQTDGLHPQYLARNRHLPRGRLLRGCDGHQRRPLVRG